MNNIPEGYKQTEVGVIPVDWEVKKLRVIADVKTGPFGSSLHERDYVDDGVGSVDRNSLIKEKENGWLFSGRLLRIRLLNTKYTSPAYLSYYFHQEPAKQRIRSVAVGQTMASLNTEILKNIEVALPPTKEEQQAIASALTDVDALIIAQEQLITKKRNTKQGAMQQLLTGKKRLPGFDGEWEVKKLGEILDYEQPTKYIVKDTEYDDNNDTPVLTAGKTLILGYTNEETGIFINLPVIIFDDFTTANKYVTYPFKIKSSAMKILKPKNENINLRFVFEKMQLIIFHLGDHKRYWISEYQNLGIELPLLPEQTAIAQILSDMDAEIEALEQKRDKYRALKQGMMQKLLTGKTRLVKEDKA